MDVGTYTIAISITVKNENDCKIKNRGQFINIFHLFMMDCSYILRDSSQIFGFFIQAFANKIPANTQISRLRKKTKYIFGCIVKKSGTVHKFCIYFFIVLFINNMMFEYNLIWYTLYI